MKGPPPPGGHRSAEGADPVVTLFLGAVVAFIAVYGFWHLFHEPLVRAINVVRLGEVWVIGWFDRRIVGVENFIETTHPADVTWSQVRQVASVVGTYLRWPVVALIVFMMIRVPSRLIDGKYRRSFDLEGLIAEQAQVWKAILPIVRDNPLDDKTGRWRPALTPVEWTVEKRIRVTEGAEGEIVIDEGAAKEAFSSQLATPWRGVEGLRPHVRVLLSIFALNGSPHLKSADRKARAQRLLDRLNELWAEVGVVFVKDRASASNLWGLRAKKSARPGMGMDEALALLPKGKARGSKRAVRLAREIEDMVATVWRPIPVGKDGRLAPSANGAETVVIGRWAVDVASRHAFAETALLSVYGISKEKGGVLPSNGFLWLRPYNRGLWYVLNGEGRNVPWVEAAGVFAHWQMERLAGVPIAQAKVDLACQGLRTEIRREVSAQRRKKT